MRVTPLVVLCLALGACGDTGEAVECDAADVVEWRGHRYLAHPTEPPRLPPGRAVEAGVRLLCGDDTRPQALQRVRGIPPEVALYPRGDTDRMYMDPGFFVALPEHRLHDRFYGTSDRPRRPDGGRRCVIDGEVTHFELFIVESQGRRFDVAVDARTRTTGFRRAGLPYLQIGDRVRIDGRRCRREALLARRIVPQP